jgi:predicted aspartyl protease
MKLSSMKLSMKSFSIGLVLAGCLTASLIDQSNAAAKKPTAKAKPTTSRPATKPAAKPMADPGGCYMVDASGRTVSLGSLCGGSGNGAGNGSSGSSAGKGTPRVVSIPIKYRAGRTPVIEVTFNGNRRFDMIVDTGASSTLITQTMANSLSLQVTGSREATIADGSTVNFPTGKIKSIAAGGLSISDAEVSIAAKMEIGLLGHDFFGNYDLQIKEKTIEFSRR